MAKLLNAQGVPINPAVAQVKANMTTPQHALHTLLHRFSVEQGFLLALPIGTLAPPALQAAFMVALQCDYVILVDLISAPLPPISDAPILQRVFRMTPEGHEEFKRLTLLLESQGETSQ